MKEIKAETKKALFDAINAVRKSNSLELVDENKVKTVGNNGYFVGQTWKLTGKLEPAVPVKNTDGKVISTYIGLETEEGQYLSLSRLAGISSMKGYSTTEPAVNEYYILKGTKVEKQQPVTVTPLVGEDFDFTQAWQPCTRDLYDLAAIIMDSPEEYRGKIVTYLGTVVRQLTAKRDSLPNNFELYKKGYKRAMSAPLFSVQ